MAKNSNDNFLTKFGNRVEKVGRDGVMGLMKSTGIPINNVRQSYGDIQNFSYPNNKNDLREINKNNNDYGNSTFRSNYNLYNNNTYKTLKNSAISNMNNFSNINNNNYRYNSSKVIIPLMNNQNNRNTNENFNSDLIYQNINNNSPNYNNNFNRINVRSNSLNYRYYNDINNNNNNLYSSQLNNNINQRNIYSVSNNRQNIVDYGYTPYTLKDYKKISNDVKLGKLGPNIGTEEWEKKRKKMKKMSDYGNKVISEAKGCYVKLAESADERHKRIQEQKLLNGKWNIINEYSRGIMLNNNKNSNEQFKRNVNNKLMDEERLVDKQFEIDMEQEEEEERILQQKRNELYQQRLNKMKNLLFN